MGWLGPERYDRELEVETAKLGAAAIAVQPETPIPTCPEWTMRDLVTHVSSGHRWSAEIVEGRRTAPPPLAAADAPEDPAAWPAWLAEGARRLSDAVRATGPDATVWTWQDDSTAGFWLRRMLHDEIVHRFDAELAGGGRGELAPELAADGVSDILDTVATLTRPPYRKFGALVGNGETLGLQAGDTGDRWIAERTPDGVTWRAGEGAADVAVRASARDLLLVLNRRLPSSVEGMEISGDSQLFTYWLENTRF